jgi:hypothetical protein
MIELSSLMLKSASAAAPVPPPIYVLKPTGPYQTCLVAEMFSTMLYRLMQSLHWMVHAVCAMFPSFDVLENIGIGVSMHSDAIGKHKLFFIHSN